MTASYVVQLGFKVDSTQLKQFQQQLDKTEKSLKDTDTGGTKQLNNLLQETAGLAKSASGGIGGMGAELGTIARLGPAALNPITLGLAAVATTGAIAVTIFKSVVGQLEEIHKLNEISTITGASVEELAKLNGIALLAGVSTEKLSQSIQKNQIALKSAKEDSSELADLYGRLGLRVSELTKMDPAEVWRLTAAAITTTTDNGLKAEASLRLMGKSAMDLSKEFGSWEQQQQKVNEASALGIVITEKQRKQAAELDDALDSLGASGASLKVLLLKSFGLEVVQAVKHFADLIIWLDIFLQKAEMFGES